MPCLDLIFEINEIYLHSLSGARQLKNPINCTNVKVKWQISSKNLEEIMKNNIRLKNRLQDLGILRVHGSKVQIPTALKLSLIRA